VLIEADRVSLLPHRGSVRLIERCRARAAR
jgi:hypothetical protein